MFWIKKTNYKNNDGYLYLRETIYKRDKRTLKRTPSVKGNTKATEMRGKYSKKKDIYCGKIEDREPIETITFKEYIENKLNKEYLDFKINSGYDELIDTFANYLLYLFGIDKDMFYGSKKKAYFIANGFFCKETIDWVKRFSINGNANSHSEIERFTLRCKDCSIFDDEIIMSLYAKMMPDIGGEIEEEIKMLDKVKNKTEKMTFEEYMRKQHYTVDEP